MNTRTGLFHAISRTVFAMILCGLILCAVALSPGCAVVGERSNVKADAVSLTNESPAVSIVDEQGSIVLAGQRPSHYTHMNPAGDVFSFGGGATSKETIIPWLNGKAVLFRGSDNLSIRVESVNPREDGGYELRGLAITSTTSDTTTAAYTGAEWAFRYATARDDASRAVILASVATLGDAIKATFTAVTGVPVPSIGGGSK